jgi:hypothetical protein
MPSAATCAEGDITRLLETQQLQRFKAEAHVLWSPERRTRRGAHPIGVYRALRSMDLRG